MERRDPDGRTGPDRPRRPESIVRVGIGAGEVQAGLDDGVAPTRRALPLGDEPPFSMTETFAPVAWSAGRWPNEDWIDGRFWWVGREADRTVWRCLARTGVAQALLCWGDASSDRDTEWFARICRPFSSVEEGIADPEILRLRRRYPGTRTFCYGTLFDGVVASIVGQSISLAAAGVTAGRLASLFHPGVRLAERTFRPLPSPADLANAPPAMIRQSGVTSKRAQALCAVGKLFADLSLPDVPDAATLSDVESALLEVPGIGPWTVASSMLWGIGRPDAFPRGDVALLRAARSVYRIDDLDMNGLVRLSEAWRPHRGEASRLLWLDLLGPAPESKA